MMKLKIFLLVSVFSVSHYVQADVWAERESLAHIERELAALEALVMTAKSQSNSKDRTTFDYRVLLDDMRLIRGGITHHLTVPMEPVDPSRVDLLSGTYTEHQ